MAHLDAQAKTCGFEGYVQKFVTFPPPKAPFPTPPKANDPECDVWDEIFNAALLVNPAFNIYRIFDTFPVLWDVLGFPYVCRLPSCSVMFADALGFDFKGLFPRRTDSPSLLR